MSSKFIFKATLVAAVIGVVGSFAYKFDKSETYRSVKSGSSQEMESTPLDTGKDQKVASKNVNKVQAQHVVKLPDIDLATANVDKSIGFNRVDTSPPSSDQLILKIKKSSALGKLIASSKAEAGKAFSSVAKAKVEVVRSQGDAVMLKWTYESKERNERAAEFKSISKSLLSMHGVEGFEEDIVLHRSMTPNDPRFQEQWHLTKANPGGSNSVFAWDKTTGISAKNSNAIAILDTGITRHSDLNANVIPGYDFVLGAAQANDGDSWDSDPSDPGDAVSDAEIQNSSSVFYGCRAGVSSWHGTHVAGIAAGVGGNGVGGIGVAPGAKIIPVRVLGKCGGYMSDISEGIRWAAGLPVDGAPINPNPAKVINMSLGGYGACPSYLQSAISDATRTGAAVVVAAGNSGVDARNFTPANCVGVIVVGSVGQTGERAYYSNFGSKVNISAPGGDSRDPATILSTLNSGSSGPGGETYGFYQGTSMAAPVISGGIALAMAANPKLSTSGALTMLSKTAQPFPSGSSCATLKNCGIGIVDIGSAIGSAEKFVPDIVVSKFVPLIPILAPSISFDTSVSISNVGLAPTAIGQSGKIEIFISEINGANPMKIGEAVISSIGEIPVKGTKIIKVSGLKIGSQGAASQLASGQYGVFARFVGGDWELSADNNMSKIQPMDYVIPSITLTKKMPVNQAPADISFSATFNDSRILRVAMGEDWVYEWNFTNGSATKVIGPAALIKVTTPGSGTATLNLKHKPSGFTTTASASYEVVPAVPSTVSFKETASNEYLRSPVTIRFSPTITTGHPLDRLAEINWNIDNGTATSKSLNAIVNFTAGTHVVRATATTKMGFRASFEKTFVVLDNVGPTCRLDYSSPEGQKVVVFTAVCSDQDGVIKNLSWYINGRAVSTPMVTPYIYRYQTVGSGILNVVVRATDDSKAFGEAEVTVAY